MKAPKPVMTAAPDPVATANAQSAMNRETAITSAQMNMINQYTPDGSLEYNVTGGYWNDGTPKYQVTQKLSPENEALRRQEQEFDRKFNTIGLAQTDKVGDILSNPLNLNNEATEARLMELGRKRLDPMFQEREQAFEQNMADRGIRAGSAAFDAARRNFDQGRNDAYNQLLLGGRQQAVQEALTERNQPLNEITALLNGQQISLPQFQNTPQTNVAGTDYAGMVYDSARINQANAQAYNQAKQANYQGTMGGLFGLGSALIGGGARMFSGGMFGGRGLTPGSGGLY